MTRVYPIISGLLIFHLILPKTNAKSVINEVEGDYEIRKLDFSALNSKVTGLVLKAGGRRYYASAELCPGGIYLPKPVNENCLCYNGIFQLVRHCCTPGETQIFADDLELKTDFKCGSSAGTSDTLPIRAILPVTKAYNRHGSALMAHLHMGGNITQWRKYDLEDIIIRNEGEVRLSGMNVFDIINVRRLGRQVKIWFGENAKVAVCYSGWDTQVPSSLRIDVSNAGQTKREGCCFNIAEGSIPGAIFSDCARGTITVDYMDIHSTDQDTGTCEDDVPEEALHKLRKRNPTDSGSQEASDIFDAQSPLSLMESSNDMNDILGDMGHIVFKRKQGSKAPKNDLASGDPETADSDGTTLVVSIPRKKGLAQAGLLDQQKAINEFTAIIRNDFTAEIRDPKNSVPFQLLKKSVDIMLKVVSPDVVPDILLKTAFDIFYFLYEGLDTITYEPPEIHQKTLEFLDQCLAHSNQLNFTTYGCPRQIDEVVVTPEIKKKLDKQYKGRPDELQMKLRDLKHPQIKGDKRFIPERFDIYVEINWKIVDFVHSFCFEYFKDETNAHHFYESELEKLFLFEEVQKRWYTRRSEKLRYVRGIFPVSQLELRMKQLDKVVAVGHHLSRYDGNYWLKRPVIDPWFIRQTISPRYADFLMDSRERAIFSKTITQQSLNPSEDKPVRNNVAGRGYGIQGSNERELIYPYHVPEKLPAGELIWDGRAVCLHASYSDSQGYFDDSNTWGVSPSLMELDRKYAPTSL